MNIAGYLGLLRRTIGEETLGNATLSVLHGERASVVCFYNSKGIDYANRCENVRPKQWDTEALQEIARAKANVAVQR